MQEVGQPAVQGDCTKCLTAAGWTASCAGCSRPALSLCRLAGGGLLVLHPGHRCPAPLWTATHAHMQPVSGAVWTDPQQVNDRSGVVDSEIIQATVLPVVTLHPEVIRHGARLVGCNFSARVTQEAMTARLTIQGQDWQG